MKNIKNKLFAIAVVISLALCFAACSGDDNPSQTNGTQSSSNTSSAAVSGDENNAVSKTEADTSPQEGSEDNATTPTENTTIKEVNPAETTQANTNQQPETSVIPDNTRPEADTPVNPDEKAEAIAKLAEAQEGVKFNFGYADPVNGFDNSGLPYYALTQNGINCPRTTGEISKIGSKVEYDNLQRGDLVFFQMNESGNVDFTGVYVGNGKAVIATSEDRPVTITDITTAWYRNAFLYGSAVARQV